MPAQGASPAANIPSFHNPTLYPHPSYPPEKNADFALHMGNWGFRGLAATVVRDTIQLDPNLRHTAYPYLAQHFTDVGAQITENIIWDLDPMVAADFPDHHLAAYAFDVTINQARPDERRLAAVEKYGHKNSFLRECQRQGIPIPHTVFVDDPTAEQPNFDDVIYPALFKPSYSSNGMGIEHVANEAELRAVIAGATGAYHIQEEILDEDIAADLSIQYYADHGQLSLLAVTEQLTKDKKHHGNIYPTEADTDELLSILSPFAESMVAEGMDDVFQFDVIITKTGRICVIECNARRTAATQPTVLAQNMDIPSWGLYNIPTNVTDPNALKLGKTPYDKATQSGVIVINNSRIATHHELEVVIAGTPEEQAIILPEVHAVVNPHYTPRDLPAIAGESTSVIP